MNRSRITGTIVFSIFLTSIVGLNFANSQPSSINGCVNKKSGLIRIADKCKNSERPLMWAFSGVQGSQGVPGEKGKPGPRGKTGAIGPRGLPGTSVLSGVGTPGIELGNLGDFYIDTSTYKLFGPKINNDWGAPKDLVGPQGPSGSTGATGATGARGSDGQTIELSDTSNAQLVLANLSNGAYQIKFSNDSIWYYQTNSFGIEPLLLNGVSWFGFSSTDCSGNAYYGDYTPLNYYVFKGFVKIPNTISMVLDSMAEGFNRSGEIAGKVIGKTGSPISISSTLGGSIGSFHCYAYSNVFPDNSYIIAPTPDEIIPSPITLPLTLK